MTWLWWLSNATAGTTRTRDQHGFKLSGFLWRKTLEISMPSTVWTARATTARMGKQWFPYYLFTPAVSDASSIMISRILCPVGTWQSPHVVVQIWELFLFADILLKASDRKGITSECISLVPLEYHACYTQEWSNSPVLFMFEKNKSLYKALMMSSWRVLSRPLCFKFRSVSKPHYW